MVLCKVIQNKSFDLYSCVNIAQDNPNDLKSLRKNADHELSHLYISAQEMVRIENFTLEAPRFTSD